MRRESLASIKRRLNEGKQNLRRDGISITVQRLAQESNIQRDRLDRVLGYVDQGFVAALEIVDGHHESWNKTIVYNLYQFAAKLLWQTDRLPTRKNLAEMLNLEEQSIGKYMARHTELAKKIRFCTETESIVFHAGRRLRFRGETVTRLTIAQETGLYRETVQKVIKKRPEFLQHLHLKEYRKRKKKSAGSALPLWLKATRRLPRKMRFEPEEPISSRILKTLSFRYGYSVEEICCAGGCNEKGRLPQVRLLAMYLLRIDAKLDFREIALLLGNRSWEIVRNVYTRVGKMRKYRVVEIELELLRAKYA